jgi:3-oxocholest-4-en-26-oyl-CoA dehydrogenase alpha subunit
MDFRFNDSEQAFYDEVDAFLRETLPPDWASRPMYWPGGYGSSSIGMENEETRKVLWQFRRRLVEKGWVTISWPEAYGGRSYTHMEQAIFDERTSYHRAPILDVIASGIVGPTLLQVGTEEQKKEWLPRIAAGEVNMWLGYSEPNAGSDLAAIRTTAVEDGDEYIINGQKVWSSRAHIGGYAWLIARTDPEAQKHKGISYFIVDNNTPGITIRPLINIHGLHEFNEVYFDNVRVPKKNLIGQKNKGFYYLMTSLDFERVILVGIGGFKRVFEEMVANVKMMQKDGVPLGNYSSVRKRLAEIAVKIEIGTMLVWKTADMLDKGQSPSVEAAALKVVATELSRAMAEAAMDVFGPYALLERGCDYAPFRGMAPVGYLDCISATIGAGTSEIQRNIIALRGLGLPLF